MWKKRKKLLVRAGYILMAVGMFYVLFINLFQSFLMSADDVVDVALSAIVAFAFAVMVPAAFAAQQYYIGKLEKRLNELENRR